MNMVVDASVIIAVITNEPTKDRLIAHTRGANLLAPASIHWEIGNAFSAMLKRRRITLDDAVKAIALYHSIPIRFVEVELTKSLEIASEYDMYAYDAYLLRCALKYTAPLITLDRKLRQIAQEMTIEVVEVET